MAATFGGMFPDENVVPGTVLYNAHYNILPVEVEEEYVPFTTTEIIKGGIKSANDLDNPINELRNVIDAKKKPEARSPPTGPPLRKKKELRARNPEIPVPLPTAVSLSKSPKRVIPGNEPIDIALPVTPATPNMGIRTFPQVQFTGPVESVGIGFTFFKIEPVRLGTLPVSIPVENWEMPIVKIPTHNLSQAPGRAARSRPILQEGVREIESFRPGDNANEILRALDTSRLIGQRAKKGGKIYTVREINSIALSLGITGTNKKKSDLVKKILERYEAWEKNND